MNFQRLPQSSWAIPGRNQWPCPHLALAKLLCSGNKVWSQNRSLQVAADQRSRCAPLLGHLPSCLAPAGSFLFGTSSLTPPIHDPWHNVSWAKVSRPGEANLPPAPAKVSNSTPHSPTPPPSNVIFGGPISCCKVQSLNWNIQLREAQSFLSPSVLNQSKSHLTFPQPPQWQGSDFLTNVLCNGLWSSSGSS